MSKGETKKKVIGFMKDESGRKIMKKIYYIKAYTYVTDNNNEYKKAKGTKKVCHKT